MRNLRATLTTLGMLATYSCAFAQFSTFNNGNGVTITAYNGPGGAVVISNTIGSQAVTALAANAFNSLYGSSGLITSLTMPNTITNIGVNAFQGCNKLVSLTLSTGISSIPGSMCENCAELASIVVPNGVTNIGSDAFHSCSSLVSVALGSGVASIGPDAFAECASLSSITLPDGCTNLGINVFYFCSGLSGITTGSQNPAFKSVSGVLFDKNELTLVQYPDGRVGAYDVPGGVTGFSQGSLWNSGGLTAITIPASLTNMGNAPFSGCTNLQTITVDANNPEFSTANGVLFDKAGTRLIQFPGGKAGSYAIPHGVTNIGMISFSYAANLNNLIIPGSVTLISDFAFEFCSGLTNILFTGDTPALGTTVFYYDTNTTAYILPNTTGWETFSGPPVVLWNPSFQTSGPRVGVQNGQFGLNIIGTAGIPIVLEACTNLTNPVWTPLASGTLTNGEFSYSEPLQPNTPSRFFGVRFP
jgi:hypothetical protein